MRLWSSQAVRRPKELSPPSMAVRPCRHISEERQKLWIHRPWRLSLNDVERSRYQNVGLQTLEHYLLRNPIWTRLKGRMNFRKNSKRPLTPPLIFGKLCFNFFYNGHGWIYLRRYESQIVWHACTLFPEIETILRCGGWVKFQFDFKKPRLKFPKSAK